MDFTRNGGSDQCRTAFLKQGDSSLGLDDEGVEIGGFSVQEIVDLLAHQRNLCELCIAVRPRCRHASPTIRSQNSARLRDAQALVRALGLGELRAFAVSLNAFQWRTGPKIPKEPDLAKTGLRNEKTQGIPWVCLDLSASGRSWLYCQNRRYWTRTNDLNDVNVAL